MENPLNIDDLGLPPFFGGKTSIYPVTSCCPSFCVVHRPRVTPARPTSATPPPAVPGGRSWLQRRWRDAPRRQRRPRRRPSVAGRGPDISLGKWLGMGNMGKIWKIWDTCCDFGEMIGIYGFWWVLLDGYPKVIVVYSVRLLIVHGLEWILFWENKVLYYSCKTLRQERFKRFSGHL